MNLAHRTINNAIFNSLSWALPIALTFLTLPYIVHSLGTAAYGILALVLSVMGYFAILDLNLGDAVIKYVAEYNAQNSLKKINETVRSVIFLYLVLGLVSGLVIFILSDTIANRFLRVPLELQTVASFVFKIGSIGVLFNMLLSALSAISNGLNRYDITAKATTLMGAGTNLLSVLLLYLGWGLKEIVILNLGISLLGIAWYVKINKQLIAGLRLTPYFDWRGIKNVLKFGAFSSLSRLASIMQFQGVSLLTGGVLGASSLTYFIVPFSLVSRSMAVTYRLGCVIFPVISSLQGKKDFVSVKKLYSKATRLILTISTAICLPLLLFGDRFLGLWMGVEFAEKAGMVIMLMGLSVYIESFTNIPSIVTNGLGYPKITGMFAIANTVINLSLVYPLGRTMGITGIALASLVAQIIICPIFILYVNKKILAFSIGKLFKEAYLQPIFSSFLTAIPLFFLRTLRIDNIWILLGTMIFSSALYLVISAFSGVFTKDEKKQLSDYMRFGVKQLIIPKV